MNVYLAVLDTLADWEVGYLTAELHSRRFFADPFIEFSLQKVGLSRQAVKSMGGITYTPDILLEEVQLQKGDLLVLPGSDLWAEPVTRPFLEQAREALDQGHQVAAICGATMGLASIGALDHRRHTSDNLEYLKQACPAYRGEAHFRDKPAVRGANLITATGLAPLEFTCEVLKMLKVWRPETVKAWYRLHKTRQSRWYGELMASKQPSEAAPESHA